MNLHTIKAKGYTNDQVRTGAWIDREDYIPIAIEFQHGQINAFWRAVYRSIRKIIKEDKFIDVLLFMNGKKDLVLKVDKEE